MPESTIGARGSALTASERPRPPRHFGCPGIGVRPISRILGFWSRRSGCKSRLPSCSSCADWTFRRDRAAEHMFGTRDSNGRLPESRVADLQWLAGLLEGEGYVHARTARRAHRGARCCRLTHGPTADVMRRVGPRCCDCSVRRRPVAAGRLADGLQRARRGTRAQSRRMRAPAPADGRAPSAADRDAAASYAPDRARTATTTSGRRSALAARPVRELARLRHERWCIDDLRKGRTTAHRSPRPPRVLPCGQLEQIEAEAPELAVRARELFDANKHKTLATLRRDGSPRISGSEIIFARARCGSGACRGPSRRWTSCAIRASRSTAPRDPARTGRATRRSLGGSRRSTTRGEQAVVKGEAPPGPMHLFRAELTELVVTGLGGDPPDHLVIESWHEGRGVERRERR